MPILASEFLLRENVKKSNKMLLPSEYILLLDFRFYVVKTLMPISALLPFLCISKKLCWWSF